MELINQFAEQWVQPVAVHVFELSFFILMIWLVDQSFRLSTKVRYVLWLLALFKMFIPPFLQLPQQTELVRQSVFVLEPISTVVATMEPAFSLSIYAWIAIFWIISIVLFATIFWVKNRQLRQLLSTARAIDATKFEITQLNTINNLRLFASEYLQTPLLTGIFRPALYLPAGFKRWPREQLESVLQHEIAHVLQRDLWVLALQTVALVLFGLNPLVWLTHRRLLHVRELRCDEIAIGKTGIHPTEYSRFLYDILQTQQHAQVSLANAINFAEDSQAIFKRFSHIFEISKKGVQKMRWWHYLVVVSVCAAVLPLSWQCSNKKILSPVEVNQAESGKFFVEFDKPPAPDGGFAAIQKNLKYPEIARKAGIEGRVILNVLVEADGSVADVKVLKDLGEGNNGCAESAIAAVRATHWQPAEKDGQPVAVWVGIPIIFRLNNNSAANTAGDEKGGIRISMPKSKYMAGIQKPPIPVGGYDAISRKLVYPEEARSQEIEYRVAAEVLISKNGEVSDIKVHGNKHGFGDAAAAAIRAVQWQPAMKDGHPVDLWISMPIDFKLGSGSAGRSESMYVVPEFSVRSREKSDQSFQAFDEPPKPVGGFASIQANLKYPELARAAGIEGRVILNVLVEADGSVADVKVLKDLGDGQNGCAEAAIAAIQKTKWQPAQYEGKPVQVWVGIPVIFKLK